jgi:hypothetical protein
MIAAEPSRRRPLKFGAMTIRVGDQHTEVPLGRTTDLMGWIAEVTLADVPVPLDPSDVARRAWITRHERYGTAAVPGPDEYQTHDGQILSKGAAQAFQQHFETAFKGSPYTAFVTHYTPEEIIEKQMKPLLANDGKTGLLIHDHGDGRVEATALFNTSAVKGAGITLLKEAIAKHGVNYAEAYGPYLPAIYKQLGLETTEQFPFDPSLAAPTWDQKKFDQPNYHLMRLKRAA